MRVATLILALFVGIASGAQAGFVLVLASILKKISEAYNMVSALVLNSDQDIRAAAFGCLTSFLFIIGGAFSLEVPVVSLIALWGASVAALVSARLGFTDMYIWGVLALILAAMSWANCRKRA
jgi:hypothetical protein